MSIVRPKLSRFGLRRRIRCAVIDRGQFVARLDLVGLDALFLAFELLYGEHLQESVLLLRHIGQALLQIIDAAAYIRDTRSIRSGGQRRTLAGLLDQHRALLSLLEYALEFLDRAPF